MTRFHWNERGEYRMKRQIPGTDFRWRGHWAWKSELLSPSVSYVCESLRSIIAALFISLCRNVLFSASDRAKNFNVNNKLKPLSHQRKTSHWWATDDYLKVEWLINDQDLRSTHKLATKSPFLQSLHYHRL